MAPRLVVGLGNPGAEYVNTRHNIGFLAAEALARRHGWTFKDERKVLGRLAKGSIDGQTIYILEPMTYMNLSGQAVRAALDYFKLEQEEVLVLVDDVAIPFGETRLREKGGSGGHNGLKSVEQHLGTSQYYRLRMGVGDRVQGNLSHHVLGRFSRDEEETLEKWLDQTAEAIDRILHGEDLSRVMNGVNKREKSKPEATEQPSTNGAGD